MINKRKVLAHADLEIELLTDKNGIDLYSGKSSRYEPYQATAKTAIDCFFQFDIQLAEQKKLVALIQGQ